MEKNFFRLNRSLIESIYRDKLTKNEILIILYVARKMGKKGYVDFDNRKVAKLFNVSHFNISKAKSSLIKRNILQVEGFNAFIPVEESHIQFKNDFFKFVVKNRFSAAQLKALIYIVKTSKETKYKSFYLSKTKFNNITLSSQSVVLDIIKLLIANKMLVDTKRKTRSFVTYYSDLDFSNPKTVYKGKWKSNFR